MCIRDSGKTTVDARDSGNLPASGHALHVPEETFERKIVLVTGNKILWYVESRKRASAFQVVRIPRIGNARRLVDRLAPGVSEQEAQVRRSVPERDLESVVAGVRHSGIVVVVAVVRSQTNARSVIDLSGRAGVNGTFAEWPARWRSLSDFALLTERETQRRIAGIIGINQQQVMRLVADIARAEHQVLAKLPLSRKKVVLGVRIGVPWNRSRHAIEGDEWRKALSSVRILDGCIQRGKVQREWIAGERAVGRRHVWLREQRRARAGIAQAVRRLRLVDRPVSYTHLDVYKRQVCARR